MLGVQTYFNKLENHIDNENGKGLAPLLSLQDNHVKHIIHQHIQVKKKICIHFIYFINLN